MDKVDPPLIIKKEMKTWSMEECLKFLETAKSHKMYIIFSLAIHTGMRRGEVLGVRWKNIDFERKTISVHQTVNFTSSQGIIIQDTKTKTSSRKIEIS